MKKKVAFLTIYDKEHGVYSSMLRNSLKHFHPDIPLIEVTEDEINATPIPRPHIFYIATPFFVNKYMGDYEKIIKIDVDSIITGSLQDVIDDPLYDVGVVQNYNPRDAAAFGQITVWDIGALAYVNNGFVAIKNEEFLMHWLMLCTRPNITQYRMREQDILNILCYYGNYNVRHLDEGPNWYGLSSKSEWSRTILRNGELVIPPSAYNPKEKTLKVMHFAGGQNSIKMNYGAYVNQEVGEWITNLVKGS